MTPQPKELRSFITPPGGVMTREVGAITGPVEAWIDHGTVRIRYVGALDIYTVGNARDHNIDEVLAVLQADPGVDEYRNPRTVDLSNLRGD